MMDDASTNLRTMPPLTRAPNSPRGDNAVVAATTAADALTYTSPLTHRLRFIVLDMATENADHFPLFNQGDIQISPSAPRKRIRPTTDPTQAAASSVTSPPKPGSHNAMRKQRAQRVRHPYMTVRHVNRSEAGCITCRPTLGGMTNTVFSAN